jgi:hypothetical protein
MAYRPRETYIVRTGFARAFRFTTASRHVRFALVL